MWYHCLCHHSFGLKRHTGHRHQHFIIFLKPHERCCAHAILYHSARRGHHSLIMIEVVHCQAALVKHFFHIEQGGFIEHHLAAEIFAKRRFGDIIFSRTKAACHKHHIGLVKGFVDGLLYLFGIVAYYLYALGFPSIRTKIAGYPTRIGVGNLPDKQLVAHYYYRIIHCFFLSVLVQHLFISHRYPCKWRQRYVAIFFVKILKISGNGYHSRIIGGKGAFGDKRLYASALAVDLHGIAHA